MTLEQFNKKYKYQSDKERLTPFLIFGNYQNKAKMVLFMVIVSHMQGFLETILQVSKTGIITIVN